MTDQGLPSTGRYVGPEEGTLKRLAIIAVMVVLAGLLIIPAADAGNAFNWPSPRDLEDGVWEQWTHDNGAYLECAGSWQLSIKAGEKTWINELGAYRPTARIQVIAQRPDLSIYLIDTGFVSDPPQDLRGGTSNWVDGKWRNVAKVTLPAGHRVADLAPGTVAIQVDIKNEFFNSEFGTVERSRGRAKLSCG